MSKFYREITWWKGSFRLPPNGSLVQRELSAQLTEGLTDLHSELGKSCGVGGRCCVVLLWGCATIRENPQGRIA